jgi:hypothetical protein
MVLGEAQTYEITLDYGDRAVCRKGSDTGASPALNALYDFV